MLFAFLIELTHAHQFLSPTYAYVPFCCDTHRYAFVPFDGNRLNRRKKAKAVGEFKGMMKGVKKGAAKASMKKLQMKRRNKSSRR
jgi:hypothetical protein